MTTFDDRIARWSIRHPWWATDESAWAEGFQETAGLERPVVESVLGTPGGPEGTAAIQDAAARLAPLAEVAEVGEPVLSPAVSWNQ
ncbi:hypothetical protein [Plantactinospora sp. DSM 117369]